MKKKIIIVTVIITILTVLANVLLLLFFADASSVEVKELEVEYVEAQSEEVQSVGENTTYTVIDSENEVIEYEIEKAQAELAAIDDLYTTDLKEWYIETQEIYEKYQGFIDPPETIYDYFTDEEINMVCRVVETECHGLSFEKKVNVANVIWTRWLNNELDDPSIIDICTAPGQFSYAQTSITDDTLLAVECSFQIADDYEAVYFENYSSNAHDSYADYAYEDGSHKFFK